MLLLCYVDVICYVDKLKRYQLDLLVRIQVSENFAIAKNKVNKLS